MLRASVAAAPTRLDLRRTRGVRGRVVPLSRRRFDATESMEKAGAWGAPVYRKFLRFPAEAVKHDRSLDASSASTAYRLNHKSCWPLPLVAGSIIDQHAIGN